MNKNILSDRTKRFALDIIAKTSELPNKQIYWIISKQLMRSATSVGANYRASCRARSKAEFISKMSIVEEEADESIYWLELLEDLKIDDLKNLKQEANEILSIVVASKITAKKNLNKQSSTIANRYS